MCYTYLLYPFLLALRPRFRTPRSEELLPAPLSVSIILAAHNEAERVQPRLNELLALLAATDLEGEIIVVSDGSTDGTAELSGLFEDRGVQVVELPEKCGKAFALTEGCALARGEIFVFGDMRQRWATDVLEQLLKNFADPTVGGVSGELVVESGPGVMAGIALYWRLEKWLRKKESRAYSTVGATGSISAVRRELFRPIPTGTLLDDVYWPLQVGLQGYRVVHEFRTPSLSIDCRKSRATNFAEKCTLAGCFQLR